MRRFAMVQRARDTDVFGILVGTLGVGQWFYRRSFFAVSKLTHSIVSTSYHPHQKTAISGKEEKLYDQCWQTESCKARKFYGD